MVVVTLGTRLLVLFIAAFGPYDGCRVIIVQRIQLDTLFFAQSTRTRATTATSRFCPSSTLTATTTTRTKSSSRRRRRRRSTHLLLLGWRRHVKIHNMLDTTIAQVVTGIVHAVAAVILGGSLKPKHLGECSADRL